MALKNNDNNDDIKRLLERKEPPTQRETAKLLLGRVLNEGIISRLPAPAQQILEDEMTKGLESLSARIACGPAKVDAMSHEQKMAYADNLGRLTMDAAQRAALMGVKKLMESGYRSVLAAAREDYEREKSIKAAEFRTGSKRMVLLIETPEQAYGFELVYHGTTMEANPMMSISYSGECIIPFQMFEIAEPTTIELPEKGLRITVTPTCVRQEMVDLQFEVRKMVEEHPAVTIKEYEGTIMLGEKTAVGPYEFTYVGKKDGRPCVSIQRLGEEVGTIPLIEGKAAVLRNQTCEETVGLRHSAADDSSITIKIMVRDDLV